MARSDYATYSFYEWVYYNLYRTGNYSSSTPNGLANFGFWDRFYVGINQCTIFLNNIDKDKQDDPKDIEMMKAEARFLRAYDYFWLLYTSPFGRVGEGAVPAHHGVLPALRREACDRLPRQAERALIDPSGRGGDGVAEDHFVARALRRVGLAARCV